MLTGRAVLWHCPGTSLTRVDYLSEALPEDELDDKIVAEMAKHYGTTLEEMAALLHKWEYNEITACYLLLCERAKKGGAVRYVEWTVFGRRLSARPRCIGTHCADRSDPQPPPHPCASVGRAIIGWPRRKGPVCP